MVKKKRMVFSNRLSFTILSIVAVVMLATAVYAVAPGVSGGWDAGDIPAPGHSIQDIGAPTSCLSGQVLQYQQPDVGAGYWSCATAAGMAPPSPCSNGQVLTYTGSSWICENSLASSWAPSNIKRTTSKHDGDFVGNNTNGYLKMNQWIQSNGCSGYHVCDVIETTRYLQQGNEIEGLVFGSYQQAWVNSGVHSFSGTDDLIVTNDCSGWGENGTNARGMAWPISYSSGGSPQPLACFDQAYVLCCN